MSGSVWKLMMTLTFLDALMQSAAAGVALRTAAD
jgi:hypothetical protein